MLIPSSWMKVRRQVIHWMSSAEYIRRVPMIVGLTSPSCS